jgi:NCS1 family nucleobase:cation symporter-1
MDVGQLKVWIKKIQVPVEPGLSTAQLMLTNDDLRPGKIIAS